MLQTSALLSHKTISKQVVTLKIGTKIKAVHYLKETIVLASKSLLNIAYRCAHYHFGLEQIEVAELQLSIILTIYRWSR